MQHGTRRSTALRFDVDADEAQQCFQARLTRGLFRPGGLLGSGEWAPPERLQVPVWRASVTLSSNWSAESGTRLGKNRIRWQPVTGSHVGEHRDLVVHVPRGPWSRAVTSAVRGLHNAARVDPAEVGDARVVADDLSPDQVCERAIRDAKHLEERACLQMVPGRVKRDLHVNSVVDAVELEQVLVPVYVLQVEHGATRHRGYVDAVHGTLFAKAPTSTPRVLAAVGGAVAALAVVVLLAVGLLGAVGTVGATLAAQEAAAKREVATQLRIEAERQEAERKEASRVAWAEQKSTLAGHLERAEASLTARDVAGARAALDEVEPALSRFRADLGESVVAELGDVYERLRDPLEHAETVRRGMAAAKEVVGDKSRCDTPLAISEAWTDLKQVTRDDPEWREAVALTARLERCRASTERVFTTGLKDVMIRQREQFAQQLEVGFLDSGLDATVRPRGRDKNDLVITWILFSRAFVHQLTDGGSMKKDSYLYNLQKAGFRKVTFSDGWNESWSYSLEPEDEDHGGKAVLDGFDLGAPLKLGG